MVADGEASVELRASQSGRDNAGTWSGVVGIRIASSVSDVAEDDGAEMGAPRSVVLGDVTRGRSTAPAGMPDLGPDVTDPHPAAIAAAASAKQARRSPVSSQLRTAGDAGRSTTSPT